MVVKPAADEKIIVDLQPSVCGLLGGRRIGVEPVSSAFLTARRRGAVSSMRIGSMDITLWVMPSSLSAACLASDVAGSVITWNVLL